MFIKNHILDEARVGTIKYSIEMVITPYKK
jgi:hypothetical protein